GIAWQVVDDAALPAASVALAGRLAELPPKAVLGTRRLMRASLGNSLDGQLGMERDLQRDCGFSYDYGEGVNAFLEKRKPRFTGR
ncbi:MAG TPA: enoyl-CoA hydratase-related protein, partial [Thalassobaculum sp.]